MSNEILYTLDDSVASIRLNRPDRLNALTPAMLSNLRDALWRAADEGARAVLISGEGRGFCSGAELNIDDGHTRDLGSVIEQHYAPLAEAMAKLPIPIVSAVNGPAAGGGAGLALGADIVVMAESAYLLLAFVNIGLVPDCGATWLVARSAGRARTLEMALLGERMSASEARHVGLVARVVPDAELMPAAQAIAAKLAAGPTRSIGMIRTQVTAALTAGLSETLSMEAKHQRIAGNSEDFAEGVSAFAGKRNPVFKGF